MGTITYKYRIEFTANVKLSPIGKNAKMTNAQLEKLRVDMNRSFLPGQVNAVVDGIVPHISRLVMKPNAYFDTNKVVAETVGPMFEVA